MKRTTVIVLTGSLLLAAACVSMSNSSPVASLPADIAANGRVDEITISHGDIPVSEGFDALFKSRVKAKLDACAKGTRPLRVEASVERFARTNPVVTAVAAGRNVIRGEARLVDIATGEEVGSYVIGQTVVGGKLGVVAMGAAETQLSDAFGTELCNQAFKAAK